MEERAPQVPITYMGYSCMRCGHKWVPVKKDGLPFVCPQCHSPYWNTPRQRFPREQPERH